MGRVLVLDTFPLSSTAKAAPRTQEQSTALDRCQRWIRIRVAAGDHLVAPAISYYEALRELERLNAVVQIARLTAFCHSVPGRYLPLTNQDLEVAAKLRAKVRNAGRPTAGVEALDGDVILAAQALSLSARGFEVIVATTNVAHLSLFVRAELWTDIGP